MKAAAGIRTQLQWLGWLPALIMLVSLLLSLTWQRFQDADADLSARGNFIARYLAASSEYGMISGSLEELRHQAHLAMQSPDVLSVSFHDVDGASVLHEEVDGDRRGIASRIFRANIYRQQFSLGDATPAEADKVLQRIGSVSVTLSEEGIAERQREILLASVAPAILALFVGLWIARRMADRLSQPIQMLSELIQRIRGGELQARGRQTLRGELATLQADINQLAVEQQRAQREQQEAMDALREARMRAESASQAKSDFLAMMSHELRTPMNGVLGMLQLLQTSRLDEQQEEYARAAVESTSHLLDVINDILDFSRVESGRLELESLYFCLREVLEGSVNNFRYVAEQKGLALELQGLDQIAAVEVNSDPTRLRQIFSNLIANAVKFTEQGFVRVRICDVNRQARAMSLSVVVEDSGIGIAPEKLPLLFDAFTQVDSSTSRRFGGTGLGLAIVRRLMRLLGGDLQVESEQGKGTRFICRFEFSIRELDQDALARRSDQAAANAFSGKVLLVEDNDVNRMVAQHMLEAVGAEVVCAVNGDEALRHMEQQQFDCVLMDIQMPVKDGLTAVREWRAFERIHARARLPVVALTANALSGERERCIEAGMDDYLAKPFQRQGLVALISRYLRPVSA